MFVHIIKLCMLLGVKQTGGVILKFHVVLLNYCIMKGVLCGKEFKCQTVFTDNLCHSEILLIRFFLLGIYSQIPY